MRGSPPSTTPTIRDALLALLAHPNIASKHWIIRQYDHEVQGNTVVRPLVGPRGVGPADAAVVEPVPGSGRGLAIACGLATGLEADPYAMTLAAIDECVRNLVCVGADPDRIAILDNFCWPSCANPRNLGSLVRAAEACYDGALAYRTPFVSGKDSLNNQFTIPATGTTPARTIEIPPTLLITGVAIVPDVTRCVTSDAKHAGNILAHFEPIPLGRTGAQWQLALPDIGGSHYLRLFGARDFPGGGRLSHTHPEVDAESGAHLARVIAGAIRDGLVVSAHDVSDGGLLCAVAEMLIAGSTPERPLGIGVFAEAYGLEEAVGYWFGERPAGYVLELRSQEDWAEIVRRAGPSLTGNILGTLDDSGELRLGDGTPPIPVDDLTRAWRSTLDW